MAVNLLRHLVSSSGLGAPLRQTIVHSRKLLHTSSVFHQDSPDYYTVLGLNRSATEREVKTAYLDRARRYHPDTNTTEEARVMFHLIAEAYDVLVDPRKRQNYDEFGSAGYSFGGRYGGPARPQDHMAESSEELYEKIFANAQKSSLSQDNHQAHDFADSAEGAESTREFLANLSFEEAALGTDFSMYLTLRVICPKCDGNKSELGYTWNICMFCEGTGIETEKVGHVLTRRTCTYCQGTKQYHKHKCDECHGTGQVIKGTAYKVPIPPGTEDGQVFKFQIDKNLLNYTIDHHPYFYLYITVDQQSYYKRDDLDVLTETDISVAQAILGGSTTIRGLHREELELDIPSGTGSHKLLTVFDEGIIRADRTHKGHHHVEVGIRVPKVLGTKSALVWERFARTETLEQGLINGLESDLSHKFQANVVEPDEVKRKFNVLVQSGKAKFLADNQKTTTFQDRLDRIFGT